MSVKETISQILRVQTNSSRQSKRPHDDDSYFDDDFCQGISPNLAANLDLLSESELKTTDYEHMLADVLDKQPFPDNTLRDDLLPSNLGEGNVDDFNNDQEFILSNATDHFQHER